MFYAEMEKDIFDLGIGRKPEAADDLCNCVIFHIGEHPN
jgi:hypothetical protein